VEAFTSQIIAVIGGVGVGDAKIVVRRMHVRSMISRIVVAESNRTGL
jgi:hypothetical protein